MAAAARKMMPTGLRLEPEILARLRASKRGLSDEIRDRLQRTFTEDAHDPVLRELRDALLNLAELVRIDCGGDWHSSPSANKEFVAAVTQRLAGYTPPPRRGPVVASDLLVDEPPDPEMLGKIREQDDRRQHSYPRLEAAQRHKQPHQMAARHMRAKQEGNNE